MTRSAAMPAPAGTRPSSVLEQIGNTALLRLRRLGNVNPNVEIYAKAEFQNPGGSVKDRAAAAIIAQAERSGRLRAGAVLLDATSGNTGIAYAMIAAVYGYRLKLCVPDNVTAERKRMLRAYGADVVLTSAMEGTDGAIREARRLFAEDPDRYWYADQYNNDANWRAHYETTGVEILRQTDGRITHFVAGLGTSGTFMGVGRRLREFGREIRLISVQPDSPLHGVEGLKHMETAIRPGIYDETFRMKTCGSRRRSPSSSRVASPARKGSSSACRAARHWPRASRSRRGSAKGSSSRSSPTAAAAT